MDATGKGDDSNGPTLTAAALADNAAEEEANEARVMAELKKSTDESKKHKARKWEKKWVRIGHLQIYKWTPCEPRDPLSDAGMRERMPSFYRRLESGAPATRSTTLKPERRVRPERKASQHITYKDVELEDLVGGGEDLDDEDAAAPKRRREDHE